ncbi:hypothetical protein PMZ80_003126 [Knufia obscura]|uniref:Uncharacterized protein n=1 Tax=Knufia obscura TaxID=1635080 RepID=A0ABR0RTC1_9EURO|nr:hypothetical protein PMZ80_003126 [Knufia obscura]
MARPNQNLDSSADLSDNFSFVDYLHDSYLVADEAFASAQSETPYESDIPSTADAAQDQMIHRSTIEEEAYSGAATSHTMLRGPERDQGQITSMADQPRSRPSNLQSHEVEGGYHEPRAGVVFRSAASGTLFDHEHASSINADASFCHSDDLLNDDWSGSEEEEMTDYVTGPLPEEQKNHRVATSLAQPTFSTAGADSITNTRNFGLDALVTDGPSGRYEAAGGREHTQSLSGWDGYRDIQSQAAKVRSPSYVHEQQTARASQSAPAVPPAYVQAQEQIRASATSQPLLTPPAGLDEAQLRWLNGATHLPLRERGPTGRHLAECIEAGKLPADKVPKDFSDHPFIMLGLSWQENAARFDKYIHDVMKQDGTTKMTDHRYHISRYSPNHPFPLNIELKDRTDPSAFMPSTETPGEPRVSECLTCACSVYNRGCLDPTGEGKCLTCQGSKEITRVLRLLRKLSPDQKKSGKKRNCYWPQPEHLINTLATAKLFHRGKLTKDGRWPGARYIDENTNEKRSEREQGQTADGVVVGTSFVLNPVTTPDQPSLRAAKTQAKSTGFNHIRPAIAAAFGVTQPSSNLGTYVDPVQLGQISAAVGSGSEMLQTRNFSAQQTNTVRSLPNSQYVHTVPSNSDKTLSGATKRKRLEEGDTYTSVAKRARGQSNDATPAMVQSGLTTQVRDVNMSAAVTQPSTTSRRPDGDRANDRRNHQRPETANQAHQSSARVPNDLLDGLVVRSRNTQDTFRWYKDMLKLMQDTAVTGNSPLAATIHAIVIVAEGKHDIAWQLYQRRDAAVAGLKEHLLRERSTTSYESLTLRLAQIGTSSLSRTLSQDERAEALNIQAALNNGEGDPAMTVASYHVVKYGFHCPKIQIEKERLWAMAIDGCVPGVHVLLSDDQKGDILEGNVNVPLRHKALVFDLFKQYGISNPGEAFAEIPDQW